MTDITSRSSWPVFRTGPLEAKAGPIEAHVTKAGITYQAIVEMGGKDWVIKGNGGTHAEAKRRFMENMDAAIARYKAEF